MIAAPLRVMQDGRETLWGVYQFAQLPSPGDRINITANGRVQRLLVTHIAHEPLHETQPPAPGRHYAWVHAEWVDEFY